LLLPFLLPALGSLLPGAKAQRCSSADRNTPLVCSNMSNEEDGDDEEQAGL